MTMRMKRGDMHVGLLFCKCEAWCDASDMACPVNGARSKQVDMLTVKSLVRQLPLGMLKTQYYFCDAPDCDVVYFASDAASTNVSAAMICRAGRH